MGKNGFLPALLGRIHAVNRTPLAALGAGGIAVAVALVFGDLTFIVKSANFCFLSSLLPASFALRKLYQTTDAGPPAGAPAGGLPGRPVDLGPCHGRLPPHGTARHRDMSARMH